MGILGLGDVAGSGRARSQLGCLLVLGIYLLQRSVYIFLPNVKVQRLSLQASVDVPVNRAHDRCELGARSVCREHLWRDWSPCLLPGLGRRCVVPQPGGIAWEELEGGGGCVHSLVLSPSSSEATEPCTSCKPTRVPPSPLSCFVPSLL